MKQFEVGKAYTTLDNLGIKYKVLSRTAATVTLEDMNGNIKRCRIISKASAFRNAESVYPMGNYSMAPILSADNEF